MWNPLKLYKPYAYIPISHVIHDFNYRIHTHASPFASLSDLNMHIEIIQDVANQLKALRTIIKIQS